MSKIIISSYVGIKIKLLLLVADSQSLLRITKYQNISENLLLFYYYVKNFFFRFSYLFFKTRAVYLY